MKKYPSKISFGLLFFILAILVGSTIPMISPPVWFGLLINLLVLTFVVHLFTSTQYIIDDRSLFIKSSILVNKKIDINRIKKISETNSIISSPAASLDRLEILYDEHSTVLISPKDKSGFLYQITQVNPKIEIQYTSRD